MRRSPAPRCRSIHRHKPHLIARLMPSQCLVLEAPNGHTVSGLLRCCRRLVPKPFPWLAYPVQVHTPRTWIARATLCTAARA
jgi:hypothetical protein